LITFAFAEPLPVQSLQLSGVSSSMATFTWLPSNNSIQDSYQLFLVGPTIANVTVLAPDTKGEVTGLQHSSNYTATLVPISQGEVANFTALAFNTGMTQKKILYIYKLFTLLYFPLPQCFFGGIKESSCPSVCLSICLVSATPP